MRSMTRREFLASSVAATLVSCAPSAAHAPLAFPGEIKGASFAAGHLLRGPGPEPPRERETATVVIVGSGISGLSAARYLNRKGVQDIVVLELESHAGGNSASGENAVSAYPWGAHYVPIPDPGMPDIIELFEDLGIITGRNPAGVPLYNEFYLCSDPMERLFYRGRWQEGLVPDAGLTQEAREQFLAFSQAMDVFKSSRGQDGKWAFAIPVDASSVDPEFRRWDRISMSDYMKQQSWNDPALLWYVDYCCRDDFGGRADEVSAWAGIHYFASRRGHAANADSHAVLTWPAGNGWLVKRLREGLDSRIRTKALVFNVEQIGDRVHVDYLETVTGASRGFVAESVIFAAPRFVAHRVIAALRSTPPPSLVYSPWLVAAVTLRSLPEDNGAPLAWDNVVFGDNSLGYVVATHQNLHPYPRRTVLSYYRALSDADPKVERERALGKTHSEWCQTIVADLLPTDAKIVEKIERIDIWIWGHGMIRPVPGFLWGGGREALARSIGEIHFAHSDMSGISLFEEAHIRGCNAAREILSRRI
jgi:hypothetical protein